MAKFNSIAVFADCGVTSHQALYRQVGSAIAKHGAHLVCVARNGQWPRALVDSAFASGGKVTIMVGSTSIPSGIPQGVTVRHWHSDIEAGKASVQEAEAILGLPGGIDNAAALYSAWTQAGGAQSQRPVGLLNRDRAFEVVRGFVADIAAVGRGNVDTLVQFSDNFEDLWGRLTRLA